VVSNKENAVTPPFSNVPLLNQILKLVYKVYEKVIMSSLGFRQSNLNLKWARTRTPKSC
jgi:hypothetical protein